MHRILISKGIQCPREDVRKMVCDKDPEGVQLRKRRRLHHRKYTSPGPNFVWHIRWSRQIKAIRFQHSWWHQWFLKTCFMARGFHVQQNARSYCKI